MSTGAFVDPIIKVSRQTALVTNSKSNVSLTIPFLTTCSRDAYSLITSNLFFLTTFFNGTFLLNFLLTSTFFFDLLFPFFLFFFLTLLFFFFFLLYFFSYSTFFSLLHRRVFLEDFCLQFQGKEKEEDHFL